VLDLVATDLPTAAKLWRSFLILVIPMMKMSTVYVVSFVG